MAHYNTALNYAKAGPRSCSDAPQQPFTRGFTGQEHMPGGTCLINFNARVYNPALGRLFSADPSVEAPYVPQDLNRYSYVLNDPLLNTDPTGLCFLGCFWQQSWFAPLLDVALVFVGLPWLEVATGLLTPATVGSALFSAFNAEGFGLLVANAGIAGGISGYAATGKIGGALISAGSAAAFAGLVPTAGNAIGAVLGGGQQAAYIGDFIASGMIGGITSVANHQNFVSGFLSGGIGSLGGPLGGATPSIQTAVVSSALAGFASVLGGGKFANGAITGAFAYAAGSWGQEAANDNDTATNSTLASDTSPSTQPMSTASTSGSSDPLAAMDNSSSTANGIETVVVTGQRNDGDYLQIAAANDNLPPGWDKYMRHEACTAASHQCHQDLGPYSGACLKAELLCNMSVPPAQILPPNSRTIIRFPNGSTVIIPGGGQPYVGPKGPPPG
jgi:RHS repeat-associated protein